MDIVVDEKYVRVKEYTSYVNDWSYRGQIVTIVNVGKTSVSFIKKNRSTGTSMKTHCTIEDFREYFSQVRSRIQENE